MTGISIPVELLGVRHWELPDVVPPPDYNVADHPFPEGRQTVGNLYSIPGQPDLLVRREGLNPRRFPDEQAVLDLLALGLQHFKMLAKSELYVPSHRHIEALLPNWQTEREGRILTILGRLDNLKPFRPEEPDQLAAAVHVVGGLATYTAQVLEGNPAGIMWDLFRKEQYSLHAPSATDKSTELPRWATAPQGVFPHDFGLSIEETTEAGGSLTYLCNLSLCRLTLLAKVAGQNATDTPYEDQMRDIQTMIATELPKPNFDRKF